MTSNEIRQAFLDFFKSKQHRIIKSDTLVPKDDPTVLFTTAGMQQFKRQFLGQLDGYTRASTSQKCLRTDDLDCVGKTAFHHTFFEMLGNFSFGDYFKREAIAWAWEFLTKVLKISQEKLWVSVNKDDQEAYDIWLKEIKVPADRIVKLGDKSNFWPSNARLNGPNGPCGPCSEIFYDYGVNPKCTSNPCDPDCSCGRFSEVWNLVFTQFNRKDGGVLEPLPSKNIDTGMGLERLVAVMQGKHSNYETDLFEPILKGITKEIEQGKLKLEPVERLIIADHIRAVVVGITDGVNPSNEGRGYVMKKLIVDSTDLVLSKGATEATFYKLVPYFVETIKGQYPDLSTEKERVIAIIRKTEEAFIAVRKTRVPELQAQLKALIIKKDFSSMGEIIFKYRDTFGLTLGTIEKTALSSGVTNDLWQQTLKNFEALMEAQKERSRAGSKMTGDVFTATELNLNVPKTKFLGYDAFNSQSQVLKIFKNSMEVTSASQGDSVQIVLDQTPFYAESGGQVGDTGVLTVGSTKVKVTDTQKISDVFVHSATIEDGTLKVSDKVTAQIDSERRKSIMRNHTATHLLQAQLRKVLGDHVKQQGSLVAEDRLRFDFTHHQSITKDQIQQIERGINEHVLACDAVVKESMDLEEAKKKGALAFFAEKYKDVVRVVSIGSYSKEFCGGTHLNMTGEIGPFKIVSESAIAQGIRRLEAVTGTHALAYLAEKENKLEKIAQNLKTPVNEALERVEAQTKRIKELEKELAELKFNQVQSKISDLVANATTLNQVKVLAHAFDGLDMNSLRKASDLIKQKATSSVSVLFSTQAEDAYLIISVTDDLVKKQIQANELLKDIAPLIGAAGGGRPQLAQAGSKNPGQVRDAVAKAEEILKKRLN